MGHGWGHEAGRHAPWGGGPPPWIAGLIGLTQGQQQQQRASGGPRGPRVRRGDVRAAVLDVLAVEPMNGYQVIQQIAARSHGGWKPSPGSVYPTISQLEDEGLVEGDAVEGRRTLRLTGEGEDYVADHPDEMAAVWEPFDEAGDAAEEGGMKTVIGQVMSGVWQIMISGTAQQQAEAATILADTRRRLYGLLAEGDEE